MNNPTSRTPTPKNPPADHEPAHLNDTIHDPNQTGTDQSEATLIEQTRGAREHAKQIQQPGE